MAQPRRRPGRDRGPLFQVARALPAAVLAAGAALHWPSALAAAQDEHFVVVKAGRVITASGDEIDKGEIVIVDGRVRLVGVDLEYPGSATVIDARGETVAPGFVLPRTRFDLPGYARSGVNGDEEAAAEVYTGRVDWDSLLRAGYTAAAFIPAGSGIPGVASVYRAAGPDDQRLLARSAYLRVTLSRLPQDKDTLRGALKRAKAEIDKVDKARQEWEKKQEEKKKAEAAKPAEGQPNPQQPSPQQPSPPAPGPQPGQQPQPNPPQPNPPQPGPQPAQPQPEVFQPPPIDPPHRPLVDLIQKKADFRALLELRRASDFIHAVDALRDAAEISTALYLDPAAPSDFSEVVAKLGEEKRMVITGPVIQRLPQTQTRYNLPAELARAGCSLSLTPLTDSPDELAATRGRTADLVRAGLGRADAIRAITLRPAELLGVASRVGSIDKGKDADLVFLDGDVLDPAARVTRVMVLGEIVWTAEDDR